MVICLQNPGQNFDAIWFQGCSCRQSTLCNCKFAMCLKMVEDIEIISAFIRKRYVFQKQPLEDYVIRNGSCSKKLAIVGRGSTFCACLVKIILACEYRDYYNSSLLIDKYYVVSNGEISESVLLPPRFSNEFILFVLSILEREYAFILPIQLGQAG